MAYPIPCPTSPFQWPADLNRYSYEEISSICGVSADFIYFVDRGEFVACGPERMAERIERVNFTLAELAKGRRGHVIRLKFERRWIRELDRQEREARRALKAQRR